MRPPVSFARLRRPGRLAGGRVRGFTALEMLIVMAIFGIMILVTMPALLNFFKAMRVRTAAQRLVSHSRLCRQVAVSRRADVVMVVQGGALESTYMAWEDKVADQTRDADGRDNVIDTDDDEVWTVRQDRQLAQDHIEIKDVYNDTTPGTYTDEFEDESSIMTASKVTLRFKPTGEVVRVVAGVDQADTMIRIRIDGWLDGNQVDRWYVSMNSSGKVDTKRVRNPTWGV